MLDLSHLNKSTLVGETTTVVRDFYSKLGDRRLGNAVNAVLSDSIKLTEKTGRPGRAKKRLAKSIAKELLDIPGFPDWIEDLAIDVIIDVMVALLFPAPAPRPE